MTALIYAVTDTQILLASDTLMRSDDGEPARYVSKILLLPHLRGAVCARGSAGLLLRWYLVLQEAAVIPDLAWMANNAERYLPTIANELKLPEDIGTTIFHFGWDEHQQRFVGHSFARKERFRARETRRNEWVVLPGYDEAMTDAEELLSKSDADGIAELMRRQRAADEGILVSTDRAGIGGEVHVVSLTPGKALQFMAYRFDDYHELFRRMLANGVS